MNPTCPECGTPMASGALAGLCPACLLKSGAAADTVTEAGRIPFIPPSIGELAALFPALEILGLIGKGGMGAVYKARQKQLDRLVALKILPPAIGDDPAFAERFAREARALAKLNHPGIVTLYEFGHVTQATGPLFFILMEFVDGVNLRQLLSGGRISPREALAIVPQICDALQFAHDQGIVHRDIKPENLLIDRRGAVKVADFGLAKLVGNDGRAGSPLHTGDSPVGDGAQETARPTNDLTDVGKVMGTPRYMAPEQSERPSAVDHRADIYALGVVFYQMLTGELPAKELRPPSTKVQIDVRLDEIVLRALERNPALRYSAVSEMKTEMETLHKDGGEESPAARDPEISPTPQRIPKQEESSSSIRFHWQTALWVSAITLLASISLLMVLPTNYTARAHLNLQFYAWTNTLSSPEESSLAQLWIKKALADDDLLRATRGSEFEAWLRTREVPDQNSDTLRLAMLRSFLALEAKGGGVEILFDDPNPYHAAGNANRIAKALSSVVLENPENGSPRSFSRVTASLASQAPVPNWRFQIDLPNTLKLGVLLGVIFGAIAGYAKPRNPSFESEQIRRRNSLSSQEGLQTHQAKMAIGALVAGWILIVVQTFLSRRIIWWELSAVPFLPMALIYGFHGRKLRMGKVAIIGSALPLAIVFAGLVRWIPPINFGAEKTAAEINMRQMTSQLDQFRQKTNQARLNAADAVQADLKARAAKAGDGKAKEQSASIASSGPATVIVLTRATNNLVGTTTDTRTVGVWSDSLLLPGESLNASSERTGAGTQTEGSYFSVMNQKGTEKTTAGFSWFFREKDGFGATEADEATSQIRDRMTERPLALIPGSPLDLFRVTNRNGSVIAGSVTFIRAEPAPMAAGKKVETTVRLRPFMGSLLHISAEVPPGYRLQASDNSVSLDGGQATTTVSGAMGLSVAWFPPALEFERDSRKMLFAQIEQLADRGPLKVVAGQPTEMFSITNKAGEVYKGFLELVGPKDGVTGP